MARYRQFRCAPLPALFHRASGAGSWRERLPFSAGTCVRLKGSFVACFRRCVSPGFVVQRRRRVGLKAGVERSETPVPVAQNIRNPWQGVAETSLQITFIKRRTMRPQDHLELLEKRDRWMMFFLPLDITSRLRNLRLAHGERAVTFLPRESGGVGERSRNPAGRIRFDFSHQLGHRLVLPQFRQDVNMVRGSIHDQRNSAFVANGAAEVFVNPRAHRHRDPRFTVLRGKHNVVQKIAIGGTQGPFRRPCSGALSFWHITPGVSLRSTPSCSSAALHCRLYSGAPPALFSMRPRVQRQRRAGLKPFIPPHPSGCSYFARVPILLGRPCSIIQHQFTSPESSAPEARRIKARSGAKRNSGNLSHEYIANPGHGVAETRSTLPRRRLR